MYNEEIAIISQAILNEVEGSEFYKLASARAVSEGTKEALVELSNEEMQHADYLKKLWKYITGGGEFSLDSVLESGILIPSPEIYKWGKVGKESLETAMSVYSIGMQMEKDSIKFYENAKLKSLSLPVAKFFDLLIKWEYVHLEQFENQYKMLTEEWWAEQGYAPF